MNIDLELLKKGARIGFVLLASSGQSALDRARKVAEDVRKYIQKQEGIELFCPEDAVLKLEDASRASSYFRRSEIDALVILHGMASPDHLTMELVRDLHVPLTVWGIPEPSAEGAPYHCGSMVGLLAHTACLTSLSRPYTFVYGMPDSEESRRDFECFLRTVIVRRALRKSKIALIGYHSPGCHTCGSDELVIKQLFGCEVDHIALTDIVRAVGEVTADEIDDDLHFLQTHEYEVSVTDPEALRRASAAWIAIKRLLERGHYAAAAPKCAPELMEQFNLSMCLVNSRLTDMGIPTSCEGDIDGALTMLIQHLFTERPPFFGDWVQRDEKNNHVFYWHCGSAPATLVNPRFQPKIADFYRGSENVALDFPLKTGDVTVSRLMSHRGRYKLLIAGGRAVESPPNMKGTYVTVRFESPVRALLDTILKHGFAQHYSIVYEDIEDELRELASQVGIEVVTP